MTTRDEAIAQVVLVTNTTPERAAQYVQLADGDPDQAVTLYFENDGADLVGASSTSQPQPQPSTTRVSRRGDPENPIDVDEEGNISDDNEPEITGYRKVDHNIHGDTFDEDARLAQRLQEEAYGEAGHDMGVRAPIARQAETLVGPGADFGMGSMDPINRRMWEMQQRRGRGFQPAGIFNQRETSAIWNGDRESDDRDILAQSTGGASEASSKASTLARLYQPPWDLIFKEPWDAARVTGREQKKWIMVDIQDGSVFPCQILNRDLWKDPSIIDTIKENFIFIQYSKEDPRADQYTQYYFPEYQNSDYYPHVAIIDPRTGERMKLWSRDVPNAAEFLMQLHEFLDRYSLSHEVRNPVAKRKSETAKKKSVDQMTEEEMLEMAMQESLAAQNNELKPPVVEDPDDLTRSVGDLRKGGSDESQYSKDDAMSFDEGSATAPAPFSLIPSDRPHVEPAPGPDITRIQIKHPAGRIIRRFALADPVRRIYEFLKAEPLEGRAGAEFELVSMGKNLMDTVDSTIEQAGLKNGTVMVEFLEG